MQVTLLAGAGVWGVVGVLPLWRKVFRSPGGWAFSAMAFALVTYLLLDSFRLGAGTPEEALLFFRLTPVVANFAPLFFLLFAKWMGFQRRRVDLLLGLPTAVIVLLAWYALTLSVQVAPWGFAPERNTFVYTLWLTYLFGYCSSGLYFLWQGTKNFRGTADRAYTILVGINSSLAAVLVTGAIVLIFVGESGSALASSVLILPGIAFALFLAPITPEALKRLLRKITTTRKEILHAFLIYRGGSLIKSRSLDGHSLPDEDIFSAVLEAIQRFMNASLPILGGGWLGAIDYSDFKILIERGRQCFLVLVTTGREDDLLRGEMMDVLQRFEYRNADVLTDWDGNVDSTTGATDVVDLFFELDEVF